MSNSLTGCLVLVVEDEPLVALDIAQSFKAAGAQVVTSRTLEDAMHRLQRLQQAGGCLCFRRVGA